MKKQIERFQGYTVIDKKKKKFFDYDFIETNDRPEIFETKNEAKSFAKDIVKESKHVPLKSKEYFENLAQ